MGLWDPKRGRGHAPTQSGMNEAKGYVCLDEACAIVFARFTVNSLLLLFLLNS